jgi:hypothetical protein
MLCQGMVLRVRTMLRTNKTEAQHVAYKKCLRKPVKTFCMLLTHEPRASRAFRAEPSMRPRARAVTRAARARLGSARCHLCEEENHYMSTKKNHINEIPCNLLPRTFKAKTFSFVREVWKQCTYKQPINISPSLSAPPQPLSR